jgi:hypothetical protein
MVAFFTSTSNSLSSPAELQAKLKLAVSVAEGALSPWHCSAPAMQHLPRSSSYSNKLCYLTPPIFGSNAVVRLRQDLATARSKPNDAPSNRCAGCFYILERTLHPRGLCLDRVRDGCKGSLHKGKLALNCAPQAADARTALTFRHGFPPAFLRASFFCEHHCHPGDDDLPDARGIRVEAWSRTIDKLTSGIFPKYISDCNEAYS